MMCRVDILMQLYLPDIGVMGFDLTRFQGEVDEELLCPICSEVLEDPLQVNLLGITKEVGGLNTSDTTVNCPNQWKLVQQTFHKRISW